MQVAYAELRERSLAVTAAIAEARSARNLMTRRERAVRDDEIDAARARRRRRQKEKEELLAQARRRVRIRMPEAQRPKIGRTTARKLFQRVSGMLPGIAGVSDLRGSDGLCSIHFDITPRGFGSTKGRRWRAGEAERAARYIVREEGLEGGEHGWWSNIAEHRTELVGFFRTVEALEKHDRSNANVYVSEIIALPAELSVRQRRKAVRRICRFFEQRGLGYVAAMHLPDAAGDQRNFHCHILYSLRPCQRHETYDWSFAVAKEDDINTPGGFATRRRQVVRDINATLHAARIDKRYTHLSNNARGMAAPAPNVGQFGTWIARRLVAMESREALLKNVQTIAGHVRSTLLDASARLARLSAEAERRRTAVTRQVAIARSAETRLPDVLSRLATLRRDVLHHLDVRGFGLDAARASARLAIGNHASQIARGLNTRKTAVLAASDAAVERTGRIARRTELAGMLDEIGVARPAATVRTRTVATSEQDRLRSSLTAVGSHETCTTPALARTRRATLDALQQLRGEIVNSSGDARRRLDRAAEWAGAIAELRAKLQALEISDVERVARSLLYLPARRRVALARLKVVTTAIGAPQQPDRNLAALGAGLTERLADLTNSVASQVNTARQRLDRAAERTETIAALQARLQALEISDVERAGRSQLHLPAWRRVVVVRLKTMSSTIGAVLEPANNIVASRAGLIQRLSGLRDSVALGTHAAGRRLEDAREQGRRLVSRGIGQGPQRVKDPTQTGHSPTSQPASSLSMETPAEVAGPPVVGTTARCDSETHERLGEHYDAPQSDETAKPLPEHGEQVTALGEAALLAAQRRAMMSAELNRRKGRQRDALGRRAIERLKGLDIAIIVNGQGEYEVAKGGLPDGELRALMDPAHADDTQAFLAEIARRRNARPVPAPMSPAPRVVPQTGSTEPEPDLATLAAAAAMRRGKARDD